MPSKWRWNKKVILSTKRTGAASAMRSFAQPADGDDTADSLKPPWSDLPIFLAGCWNCLDAWDTESLMRVILCSTTIHINPPAPRSCPPFPSSTDPLSRHHHPLSTTHLDLRFTDSDISRSLSSPLITQLNTIHHA